MSDFRIFFYKVGDGHCSYIEFPNGKKGLVDVKVNKENNYDNIIARFEKAEIKKIDYLFITHPHQDHISGLSELIKNFKIGSFLYSPIDFKPDPVYEDWNVYEKMKQGNHCEKKYEVKNGWYTDIGDCKINYLAPVDELLEKQPNNVNNNGLLLKITCRGHKIIIPGDIESDGWEYIKDKDIENSTLLLASHHGNKNGYNLEKIKKMNPAFVVISAGPKTEHDADQRYKNIVRKKVYTTRQSRVTAKIDEECTLHMPD